MKRKWFLLFILLLCINQVNFGQNSEDNDSILLDNLFFRLESVWDDSVRIAVNDSIIKLIDSYTERKDIFYHSMSNLKFLGQVTSSDSLIKILGWNLVLRNSPSRYHCYFIIRDSADGSNYKRRLITEYNDKPVVTDTTYTERSWYGCLYYGIQPYLSGGKKSWIILGIDYGNPLISRKIIDVVTINKDKSLLFGSKWFESGGVIKYREVFEYSARGTMSLRFGSDSSIVFDHLVPFSPELAGNRQFYGPDYSNDAYLLEKGIWRMTINIDARNKE